MSKKTRITEALIKRVEQVFNEGTGSLTRPQLRALHRKGYLTRRTTRTTGDTLRYQYDLKRSF